jgi:hypothetical protein
MSNYTVIIETGPPINVTTFPANIGPAGPQGDPGPQGIQGIQGEPGVDFIRSLADLPSPVGNVITLDTATDSRAFSGTVDLLGNRIVVGTGYTIRGTGAESAFITSTGLPVGEWLISSSGAADMPVQNITIKDVAKGVSFDSTSTYAADWQLVNFRNVAEPLEIGTCSNFVATTCGFLDGSGGVKLTGTVGTLRLNFCFWLLGSGAIGLDIAATAIAERRVFLESSAMVVLTGGTGVNVAAGATIPDSQLILGSNSFSGAGTYLSGVTVESAIANFIDNTGITNSAAVGAMSLHDNVAVTTINAVSTPVKVVAATVAGVPSLGIVNQAFTHTSNRLTYTGGRPILARVTIVISISGGNNQNIGVYIAKNGTPIPEYEAYTTTGGTGRSTSLNVEGIVPLVAGDYVETWVENVTSTTSLTASDLSVFVRESASN